MDGLLLVDKPIGPTSHDIVARARRVLGERRIGHAGTLDPLASGLLALVLGRATRLARFLSASDKSYDAEIRLGIATDTYDALGEPTMAAHVGALPARDAIERALDAFRGTFLQQPPAYSAKKVDGQRSYDIARTARARAASGTPPALSAWPGAPDPSTPVARTLPAAVSVAARAIELVACAEDRVTLRVVCSAGFYIRSLAHDLGQRLGTGAHLTALRRTRSGPFSIAAAVSMDVLERDPGARAASITPLSGMLPDLPFLVLTAGGVQRAAHGRNLGHADFASAPEESRIENRESRPHVRLLDPAGELLAIAEPLGAGLLHPFVVLR